MFYYSEHINWTQSGYDCCTCNKFFYTCSILVLIEICTSIAFNNVFSHTYAPWFSTNNWGSCTSDMRMYVYTVRVCVISLFIIHWSNFRSKGVQCKYSCSFKLQWMVGRFCLVYFVLFLYVLLGGEVVGLLGELHLWQRNPLNRWQCCWDGLVGMCCIWGLWDMLYGASECIGLENWGVCCIGALGRIE